MVAALSVSKVLFSLTLKFLNNLPDDTRNIFGKNKFQFKLQKWIFTLSIQEVAGLYSVVIFLNIEGEYINI